MKKIIKSKLILFLLILLFGTVNQEIIGLPNNETTTLSLMEVQKLVDGQWVVNRRLIEGLDVGQFIPNIYLNTYMNASEYTHQSKNLLELQQQIDFNEKLQHELAEFNAPEIYLKDLNLQLTQLRIAFALNKSLISRGQHNLTQAMAQLENCFENIALYQQQCNENSLRGFFPVEKFIALASYQKGKIHRVKAGLDPDQLDFIELADSEKSYLSALAYSHDNAAIHGSLGFLYLDMHKKEKALQHFEIANQLEPQHPKYIQGIANIHYQNGIQEIENGQDLAQQYFMIAEENFKRALQLYNESNHFYSSLYLDYGKLQMFLGNLDEALNLFNEGLQEFPEHSLLLMARGVLLEKLGRRDEGLKDLKKGLVAIKDKNLKEKYFQALKQAREEQQMPMQGAVVQAKKNLCTVTSTKIEKRLKNF